MAGYRGHITLAVIFGALLVIGLAYSSIMAGASIEERVVKGAVIIWLAVIFALFPDIDIKSKGQLLFYRLFFLLDLLLLLGGRTEEAALLGFLALIPILSRHRGWTHTVWAMLLIPLPILAGPIYFAKASTAVGLPYYLGAVSGYLSHLIADGTIRRRGFWWWW
ncbi:MAG TPA: metal-dependent hydrolase [Candidatus Kapabacteria bacterium]|nr:metal-dependent hydrolase [Candidatus Kapabacteria bacterium]